MPDTDTAAPPPMGDNKPPMAEVAKADITEQLAPLKPRLDELIAALGRAKCETADDAGKCADLTKQFKKLKQRIDNVRKDVKEPYSEAVSVIDGAPKPMIQQIDEADRKLRGLLMEFDTKQRAIEAEARRKQQQLEQEERDRVAQAEAAAAAAGATVPVALVEPEPEPDPAPKRAAPAPVASGDYGAAAHRRETKEAQITDVYALPRTVLEAPAVREAILKVVRAMRTANPEAEISGVEIVTVFGLQVR